MTLLGLIAQRAGRVIVGLLLVALAAGLTIGTRGATAPQSIELASWRGHPSDCRWIGNRICGPDNDQGVRAGCYRWGRLVIPWSRYDRDQYGRPSRDPLWA